MSFGCRVRLRRKTLCSLLGKESWTSSYGKLPRKRSESGSFDEEQGIFGGRQRQSDTNSTAQHLHSRENPSLFVLERFDNFVGRSVKSKLSGCRVSLAQEARDANEEEYKAQLKILEDLEPALVDAQLD